MLTANSVIKDLKRKGTAKRAKASAWFFKTGKGDYGYGDVFFGVTVPEQRKIAKRYSVLPLSEISKLLKNKVHECRLTALFILVGQYKRADAKGKARIAKFYIVNRKYVNNWDLVDSSAGYILGDYLLNNPPAGGKSILYKFARSKNLWERRIAIITTQGFIRNNAYADTLKIAKILLNDKHDLIHKAVGWMLREVGNRSLATEEKFLKKYAFRMPRTMLRYAIEKFPEKKRKTYLSIRLK
ncbi:MAG: alkylation repair enzyme superfamily protein [Parcubacteria group bacterium GW2011_GWB1_40_14]|nr:MAG: alkylation repair enzyme superfamily protein [Parcubacteria group bacterium GW2011_GWB1_40_14]